MELLASDQKKIWFREMYTTACQCKRSLAEGEKEKSRELHVRNLKSAHARQNKVSGTKMLPEDGEHFFF